MEAPELERRLAAIFAADGRLVHSEDEAAMATLLQAFYSTAQGGS